MNFNRSGKSIKAVLLGVLLALGLASMSVGPVEAVGDKPPTKTETPPIGTSTPGGCAEFCKTIQVKNCALQPCRNLVPVVINNFCTCECRDKCDGGGRLIRK